MIAGFDPRYQFIHADDVVSALEFAVENELPGVYNVAPDGVLALSEVIDLLGKRALPVLPPFGTGGRRVCAAPGRRRRSRREMLGQLRYGRGLDNRKLKAAGFRYRYTTRETVEKFGEHLRLRTVLKGVARALPLREGGRGLPALEPERAEAHLRRAGAVLPAGAGPARSPLGAAAGSLGSTASPLPPSAGGGSKLQSGRRPRGEKVIGCRNEGACLASAQPSWRSPSPAAALVLAAGAYAYDSSRDDLIAKGVTVAGVDVGGLRAGAARDVLRDAPARAGSSARCGWRSRASASADRRAGPSGRRRRRRWSQAAVEREPLGRPARAGLAGLTSGARATPTSSRG